MVADGTPDDLEHRSRYYNAVSLSLPPANIDSVREGLHSLAAVASVEQRDTAGVQAELIVVPEDGGDILGEVSRLVRESGWEVDQIRVERGHLDEVFRTITTGEALPAGGDGHA